MFMGLSAIYVSVAARAAFMPLTAGARYASLVD